MTYPTIADCALPYHLDGSVVKIISTSTGVIKTYSLAEMLELNDEDYTVITNGSTKNDTFIVIFFPELVSISGLFALFTANGTDTIAPTSLKGSSNSTNGLDGTWTDATMPDGYNSNVADLDSWRKSIAAVSGLTSVNVVKLTGASSNNAAGARILHLYGHKVAGQTPDDILFLDAQNADAEFSSPLNYGDVPAGTSVIRQIKLKNDAASLTANNVDITVIDPDDVIRISMSSGGAWVTTLNFAGIAAAAKTAVIFVKCETAAPPTPLGPNRAPIKVTVGSWS